MKKRILKIMLLAVMAFLATMPLSAFAETTAEIFGGLSQWSYTIGDLTYTEYALTPEVIITDCAESATEIIIPDNVTGIGDSAFKDCSALTSITIPDSVTNIEKNAFFHRPH